MQNLTQFDPAVWSVGGGAIDLAPAHFQLRAHLYKKCIDHYQRRTGAGGGRAFPLKFCVRQ